MVDNRFLLWLRAVIVMQLKLLLLRIEQQPLRNFQQFLKLWRQLRISSVFVLFNTAAETRHNSIRDGAPAMGHHP